MCITNLLLPTCKRFVVESAHIALQKHAIHVVAIRTVAGGQVLVNAYQGTGRHKIHGTGGERMPSPSQEYTAVVARLGSVRRHGAGMGNDETAGFRFVFVFQSSFFVGGL